MFSIEKNVEELLHIPVGRDQCFVTLTISER